MRAGMLCSPEDETRNWFRRVFRKRVVIAVAVTIFIIVVLLVFSPAVLLSLPAFSLVCLCFLGACWLLSFFGMRFQLHARRLGNRRRSFGMLIFCEFSPGFLRFLCCGDDLRIGRQGSGLVRVVEKSGGSSL